MAGILQHLRKLAQNWVMMAFLSWKIWLQEFGSGSEGKTFPIIVVVLNIFHTIYQILKCFTDLLLARFFPKHCVHVCMYVCLCVDGSAIGMESEDLEL